MEREIKKYLSLKPMIFVVYKANIQKKIFWPSICYQQRWYKIFKNILFAIVL